MSETSKIAAETYVSETLNYEDTRGGLEPGRGEWDYVETHLKISRRSNIHPLAALSQAYDSYLRVFEESREETMEAPSQDGEERIFVVELLKWKLDQGKSPDVALRETCDAYFRVYRPGVGQAAIHPTEKRYPMQCAEFKSVLGQMYQIHLERNEGYSPANILGTGQIGLVTRLWDKIARLLALTGFRIKVEFEGFEEPREPRGESVDDNLLDAGVYAVIGQLLRKGVWGK